MDNEGVHIAMFPSPGMGHVIPFVHLAKLLLHRRHISSATLILPSTTSTAILQSLPESIRLHHLPPITVDPSESPESEIFHNVTLSLPFAQRVVADLASSSARLAALVLDPFGLDLLDAVKELNVPVYMYFGTAATNLLFSLHLRRFDKMLDNDMEFADHPDPFILPGCPPLHGRDFGDPFKSRKSPIYKKFLHQSEKTSSVNGILVNTFHDMEPEALNAINEHNPNGPKVFPIGPIVQTGGHTGEDSRVVEWLNGQPTGSVLYVSFGSGGALSHEQTKELAMGLEESGKRFLWVVRSPNDSNSCPSYSQLGPNSKPESLGFLPEGFIERTRGRGLVVWNWVPQVEVLCHVSTRAFLTHCGWNSVVESLMHGVPMIAWPLYAEQRTNAVVLTDGIGVAIRPEGDSVVTRHVIATLIRRIVGDGDSQCEKIRERAMQLKESARKALGDEGSSTLALRQFSISLKS